MFNGSDFHQAALVDEGSELENEGELVDFSAEVFTEGDEADEILQDIIDNVDADSEDKVRLGLGGTRAGTSGSSG